MNKKIALGPIQILSFALSETPFKSFKLRPLTFIFFKAFSTRGFSKTPPLGYF